MVALTANINLDEKVGDLVLSPVVASDIIFKGALVKHTAAGFIAPCAAELNANFAGVAYENADNSAGAAGAVSVRVQKSGMFLLTGAGLAQGDVGKTVYATDDNLISTTQATNQQAVGKIVSFVSATKVWVRIDNFTA